MVLRQKVWIDDNVQGILVGRVVLYWSAALVYVGLGSACFQYYQNPHWEAGKHVSVLFDQIWPWLPSAILCLPLVIFDVIRLSNLFVGPIYRLRQHLAALIEEPACVALKFREDDHWQDLVEPMHCIQAELVFLRGEVARLRQLQLTSESKPAAAASLVNLDLPRSQNLLPPMGLTLD